MCFYAFFIQFFYGQLWSLFFLRSQPNLFQRKRLLPHWVHRPRPSHGLLLTVLQPHGLLHRYVLWYPWLVLSLKGFVVWRVRLGPEFLFAYQLEVFAFAQAVSVYLMNERSTGDILLFH